MTELTEVVTALHGWVERIAGLGAGVVPRLRPGADADTIARVAARHGFTLTEEIAAVWAWHDGARLGSQRGPDREYPGLVPGGVFYDLDTTLETCVNRLDAICGDDDLLRDPDVDPSDKAFVWRREWVVLDFWLLPLVLAARPDGSTDTFRYDPQSGTEVVAHSSLPERVARWHEMLNTGAWVVLPDGTWHVDLERLPEVDRSWPVDEQIRWTEIL
ncbi:hypothetical protein [Cellulomonas sp. B6]|uniref:hypothetical protein n=1 Tax=Cellulomonas sp. B6 TaxID=1295626 RepID=UPI00073C260D|nr:hypothetical protein [Cellulomonas sp. B6]KSW21962.1 hypothetical protein ATM99_13040 [Cellulomonas sp. B6]